ILERIVASKRREIEARRQRVSEGELERRLAEAPPLRDFRAALEEAEGLAIIAEVKKASPSAGVIRADFDPLAIARIYESAGAAAISVLTDEPFFQGSLDYLKAIRQAVRPPLLRKDFLVEPYQLLEARLAGADAVLLIAEILGPEELPRVPDSGARLVGINNRALRTSVPRLEHTLDLAPHVRSDCCLVSESGI